MDKVNVNESIVKGDILKVLQEEYMTDKIVKICAKQFFKMSDYCRSYKNGWYVISFQLDENDEEYKQGNYMYDIVMLLTHAGYQATLGTYGDGVFSIYFSYKE